jgi:hypothetical protein
MAVSDRVKLSRKDANAMDGGLGHPQNIRDGNLPMQSSTSFTGKRLAGLALWEKVPRIHLGNFYPRMGHA